MARAKRHGEQPNRMRMDVDGLSLRANDIAVYLSSILPQYIMMAERAQLDLAAYLLEMARQDLEEQIQRIRAG